MENLDRSGSQSKSLSLIAEYGISDTDSDDTETDRQSNELAGTDSDPSELSEMVLKNNIINACAHGPIPRVNPLEDVERTRHMIIDSIDSGVVEYEVTEYRDVDSSSSDSDSDVDSVKDVEEVSSGDEAEVTPAEKLEPPKVAGEMGLEELPPIEDLAISLPAQETTKIGTIASIVDRLVIVRAFPETPAVDLDSVLFLDNGAKALGKVFDVFGPVTEPHYCVRFNSAAHVRERGVQPGLEVFIAPRSQHTSYVFLTELMKMKGSDASWLNDIEPPPHQVEYSDDEEERRAKAQRREQGRQSRETREGRENRGREQGDDSEDDAPRSQKKETRRQRPLESSSRFGSGPSRGRNPFNNANRRNPNSFNRFARPWGAEVRTPPHPVEPRGQYGAPPPFHPPTFPPFNMLTPPPFMNAYQFGAGPRMAPPPMPMGMPPFRHNNPPFGGNYCTLPGQPQWVNAPPPPPGT